MLFLTLPQVSKKCYRCALTRESHVHCWVIIFITEQSICLSHSSFQWQMISRLKVILTLTVILTCNRYELTNLKTYQPKVYATKPFKHTMRVYMTHEGILPTYTTVIKSFLLDLLSPCRVRVIKWPSEIQASQRAIHSPHISVTFLIVKICETVTFDSKGEQKNVVCTGLTKRAAGDKQEWEWSQK